MQVDQWVGECDHRAELRDKRDRLERVVEICSAAREGRALTELPEGIRLQESKSAAERRVKSQRFFTWLTALGRQISDVQSEQSGIVFVPGRGSTPDRDMSVLLLNTMKRELKRGMGLKPGEGPVIDYSYASFLSHFVIGHEVFPERLDSECLGVARCFVAGCLPLNINAGKQIVAYRVLEAGS